MKRQLEFDSVMMRSHAPARCLILVLAVLLVPLPRFRSLAAQENADGPDETMAEQTDTPFGYRKYAFAALGAALGMVPAYFADVPDSPRSCQSRACLMALGSAVGGLIGYLVGNDLDREAAERFGRGPSLQFQSRAIELGLVPADFSVYRGGALVYGQTSLAVVMPGGRVRVAAENVRGIMAAEAFPISDVILTGTTSGVYSFPLRQATPAQGQHISDNDGVTTLERAGPRAVLMGGGGILRRLRVTGGFGNLDLVQQARVPVSDRFRSAAVSTFSGVLWSLSGEELVARTLSSLEPLSRVRLPTAGNSLTVNQGRALITAGTDGLYIVNIEDPEAPRLVGHVDGMPFAFDADMRGDTAYIAAGQSGLLVVDISQPADPRTLGLARNIGFASAVELAPAGGVYVLDKRGRRLLVLELTDAESD